MANLVVRVERQRRMEAVAAATEAAAQRLAAEQRALDAERQIVDERRRLSQEIHDGVSQRAYMLTLGLENARVAAERDGAADLAGRLATLQQVSKETLFETRNLLFDLGRVMSGESSIEALAGNLAAEFSAVTGIEVLVRAEASGAALAPAQVGDVFRILQESLANVMKHAQATRASVTVVPEGDSLRFAIEDNGRGFDPGDARAGHGLANIRDRAARLGGGASFESTPGGGTLVSIRIPIERASA
jgi:signal transduction histidine kinase